MWKLALGFIILLVGWGVVFYYLYNAGGQYIEDEDNHEDNDDTLHTDPT